VTSTLDGDTLARWTTRGTSVCVITSRPLSNGTTQHTNALLMSPGGD
jgi:hypothetical protein